MLRRKASFKLSASERASTGEPEAVKDPKQVIFRRKRLHTAETNRARGKRSEQVRDDDGKGSAIASKQRINERVAAERRRLPKKRQSLKENAANYAADPSYNTRQKLRRCTAKPSFFDKHRRRIREQMRLKLHVNGNVVVRFHRRARELKDLKQEVIQKEAGILESRDRIENLERQLKRIEQESERLEEEILMLKLQRTSIIGGVKEKEQRESKLKPKQMPQNLEEHNNASSHRQMTGKALNRHASMQNMSTSTRFYKCTSEAPTHELQLSRSKSYSLEIPEREYLQENGWGIDQGLDGEDLGNHFYRDVPQFDCEQTYRSALLNLVNIQDAHFSAF